ncbi:hypothetical protein FKN01_29840 [Streptomyces sp. 130]|uniref:hypothetical protein n=1 Tax=Streptomyces sp. 130 TaxID=2591006 RepID=UPI00117EE9E3|nr:hypothetical protein [Streptomyces sp. 130]TRV72590.1 hypothetical protein FKN01_29840 [Streptomyces sp. 130]
MDTTPNYGIPYPECDPPLVKDASTVTQIAALAYAADAALDTVYAQAEQDVFNPDSVRMQAASVTGTGQDRIPVFTSETVDTGGMSDTSTGVVQIVEPGRYYVGAYTSSTTSTLTQLRVRFLINGSPVSNFQTPGYATPLSGSMIAGYADAVLSFQEPVALSIQIRHSSSGATSWNSQAELWATQLEAF